LLNSRLDLFTAALAGLHPQKHPFSRSYGVILPSSLTRVLPSTLGFSPHLPVSVYGTGTFFLTRGFSWQCEIRDFATAIFTRHHSPALCRTDLPIRPPHCLDVLFQSHARLTLLRHPFAQTVKGGTGISTCCPSSTPFGLDLGPDLP